MNLLDLQIMHVLKLSREFAGDQLLDEALAGEPRSIDSVSSIYEFVCRHFGRDTESDVSKKFWPICATYLASMGFTKEQLQKLRRPFPVFGEPGFKSILDEMREERPDLFEGD
jgi:hypothetical protein